MTDTHDPGIFELSNENIHEPMNAQHFCSFLGHEPAYPVYATPAGSPLLGGYESGDYYRYLIMRFGLDTVAFARWDEIEQFHATARAHLLPIFVGLVTGDLVVEADTEEAAAYDYACALLLGDVATIQASIPPTGPLSAFRRWVRPDVDAFVDHVVEHLGAIEVSPGAVGDTPAEGAAPCAD